MKDARISKAALGRMPVYLRYLNTVHGKKSVSSVELSRQLGFGEVQVRKDLNSISDSGRPKLGFAVDALRKDIAFCLGIGSPMKAVVIGAGKLGRALLGYQGFEEYGLQIAAAFDNNEKLCKEKIYPIRMLDDFCRSNNIKVGIITVPTDQAQDICNLCIHSGITAIWSFAACELNVPENVIVCREDLALSLAHLALSLRMGISETEV